MYIQYIKWPVSEPLPGRFGRLLHADAAKLFPVRRLQQPDRPVIPEPVRLPDCPHRRAPFVVHHLDPLQLAEPGQPVPAHEEGHDHRHPRHHAHAPVGLFDEVFQVHSVQAGQERAHGQAQRADAELEVQQHERVAIGVEDGPDAVDAGQ